MDDILIAMKKKDIRVDLSESLRVGYHERGTTYRMYGHIGEPGWITGIGRLEFRNQVAEGYFTNWHQDGYVRIFYQDGTVYIGWVKNLKR